MSSVEQPVDQQLIEQTRRQIQGLVAEIEQLSRRNCTPAEFYAEFLTRIVSAMAALGGAIWTVNEEGRLALQQHLNFHETGLGENEENQARHGRLLYQVMAGGEGAVVPPHALSGENEQAGNPTDMLLIVGPLKTDLEMVGLVEIFQRADTTPAMHAGYLRFLLEMCERATDFLKSHQLRHFSDRQVLWSRLEDFTRSVHASLEPIETAYTIANEARRLIECDRVSIALRKGKTCTIEAISGQDVFDKRSNTVRLLGKLASAVVATGDPIWYVGDTRDMAPQVEDAVQEYVDEAHSKMIAVLPLGRPKPDEEDDPDKREAGELPIGALIVEQIEDNRIVPAMAQRVEVVCRHSSTALANAVEHQSLFLMPVWRAIGKSRWVVQARTLPKTIAISLGVLAVVLFLVLCPANFTLDCKGTLEPVERRDVFAGADGVVENVLVEHDSRVQEGALLVQLRNTDLELAKTKVSGLLRNTNERIQAIAEELTNSRLRPEERDRLKGDLAEKQAEQIGLKAQYDLCEEKLKQLQVKSPINGVIVTWDLQNRLAGRPVQKGQLLMRMADPDPQRPWQVELHMAENHMGPILKAQQALYDQSRQRLRGLLRESVHSRLPDASEEELSAAVQRELDAVPDSQLHDKLATLLPGEELSDQLPVTYILATEPGTTRKGEVVEIHRSAVVRGEEGNTVLIKVAIRGDDLPVAPRPGATVSGKVYCGRTSLGYAWFHDVVAFIQSRILFPYF